MTVTRGLLVIAMLLAVGVAVVALREESARVANRVQRLHRSITAAHQGMWKLEMELATLRTPDRIRLRAASLGLNVVAPAERRDNAGPPLRSRD